MPHVSEHDPEQEWEGHNGEQPWVDLFVPRHTISVNDFLLKLKLDQKLGQKIKLGRPR